MTSRARSDRLLTGGWLWVDLLASDDEDDMTDDEEAEKAQAEEVCAVNALPSCADIAAFPVSTLRCKATRSTRSICLSTLASSCSNTAPPTRTCEHQPRSSCCLLPLNCALALRVCSFSAVARNLNKADQKVLSDLLRSVAKQMAAKKG